MTARSSLNEAFAEHHAAGMNDGDIAVALGISRNAVIGLRYRLKLKCNYTTAREQRKAQGPRVYKRREPKLGTQDNGRASRANEGNSHSPVPTLPKNPPAPPVPDRQASEFMQAMRDRGKATARCLAFDNHPIMSLTPFTCRWPKGDPGNEDFSYCCAPKAFEDVYCREHKELAKGERRMR